MSSTSTWEMEEVEASRLSTSLCSSGVPPKLPRCEARGLVGHHKKAKWGGFGGKGAKQNQPFQSKQTRSVEVQAPHSQLLLAIED